MKRKGKKNGDKSFIPRHRGRRGNHYGDPGKGSPGALVSRGSMDSAARTIERRTRQEGKKEIKEQMI